MRLQADGQAGHVGRWSAADPRNPTERGWLRVVLTTGTTKAQQLSGGRTRERRLAPHRDGRGLTITRRNLLAGSAGAAVGLGWVHGPAAASPLDARSGPTMDGLTTHLRRVPRVMFGTTPNQLLGEFQGTGGFRCVDWWWTSQDEVAAHSSAAKRQAVNGYYGQNVAVCLYIWTAPERDPRNSAYNLSPQFLIDLDRVIGAYMPLDPANQSPFRVVLFTEIENFSPAGDPAYRTQLTQQFLLGIETIHGRSPTAQVGCGFIASSSIEWKAGNPRSRLSQEWGELIAASDFASTNMMMDTRDIDNGNMARATRAAIRQLGETGKPVHINHWVTWIVASQKPIVPINHHTQAALVYLRDIFTDASMSELVGQGLRWWGWKAEGWITERVTTRARPDPQDHGEVQPQRPAITTTPPASPQLGEDRRRQRHRQPIAPMSLATLTPRDGR